MTQIVVNRDKLPELISKLHEHVPDHIFLQFPTEEVLVAEETNDSIVFILKNCVVVNISKTYGVVSVYHCGQG